MARGAGDSRVGARRDLVRGWRAAALRDRGVLPQKSLLAGAAWLRDAQLHREFVSFLAEMQAARRLLRRVLEESETPQASASVLPSIVKLSSTVLRQRICSFMVRISIVVLLRCGLFVFGSSGD